MRRDVVWGALAGAVVGGLWVWLFHTIPAVAHKLREASWEVRRA